MTATSAMVTVRAVRPHRALGERRNPKDEYRIDRSTAQSLRNAGLVEIVAGPDALWDQPAGRLLRTEDLPTGHWSRVVACLNIWQDRAALELTLPTWIDHVDHVVAVDGAYLATGARKSASTDGTVGFLRELGDKVTLIEAPARGWWNDQNMKRNAYLHALQPGDLAFVIDADEFVTGASELRTLPEFDVGWVRLTSALYERQYGQPRLFRARAGLEYRGRHHWIFCGDQLVTTHQYGGPVEHHCAAITLRNARGLGHDDARAKAKRQNALVQNARETKMLGAAPATDARDRAREALRICQVAMYDAGMVVSRLHSGINATTPHSSMCFRAKDGAAYFQVPTQRYLEDVAPLEEAIAGADVVHCHLKFGSLTEGQLRAAKRLVLHHHGTMYRTKAPFHNALAQHYRALVLVSNLELLQYSPAAHWLPNPVPVARYQRLGAVTRAGVTDNRYGNAFRVSHSPSKRHLKGTDDFLTACKNLQDRGIPIEPVLIEQKTHRESLAIKASCHAAFDSFWLGIQCSGIEAAAMGQPVIAGDDQCRAEYTKLMGAVPYTFANDAKTLENVLERLVVDPAFRAQETHRVVDYVTRWHDEAAVAIRYLDLLDAHFGWRDALTVRKPAPPTTPMAPDPTTPAAPVPAQPAPADPEHPVRAPIVTR